MVLFDTNALMMAGQFSVDPFEGATDILGDYDAVTLEGVRKELQGISRGRGADGASARIGLALLSRCRIVEGEKADTVDDQILRYAEKHGCAVVTNDRDLKNALLARKIPVLTLREKKRLEIIRG